MAGGVALAMVMIPIVARTTEEMIKLVPQNLREVAPHIFLAVPRVWEKLYSVITIQIKEGTALGRLAYKGAIAAGYKASAYELEGRPSRK